MCTQELIARDRPARTLLRQPKDTEAEDKRELMLLARQSSALALSAERRDRETALQAPAEALARAPRPRPSAAAPSLLELQRRYGNQFVQRVVDLSRRDGGVVPEDSTLQRADVAPASRKKPDDARIRSYVEDALKRNKSLEVAWLDLQGKRDREENCLDESLAAAEHYLFARYVVAETLFPAVTVKAWVHAYSLAKRMGMKPRLGACPVTPTSVAQVKWGLQGVADGQADFWKRSKAQGALRRSHDRLAQPVIPGEGQVLALEQRSDDEQETIAPGIEAAIQRARGGGHALDNAVRAQMEPFFGANFSHVRIHSDSQADTLSRTLNARAFTTGKDIFFRQGEYSPTSTTGQELLAHELTHVMQQHGLVVHCALTLGRPGDKYEEEADRVASAIVRRERSSDANVAARGRTTTDEVPLLLRPQVKASTVELKTSALLWKGTSEQMKFMADVLSAAKTARNKKKEPYHSLETSELSSVPDSGGVKMRSEAAVPAGRLLAAAKNALAEARRDVENKRKADESTKLTAVDEDILNTLDVRISGYRSVEEEEKLWSNYFPGYYNRTVEQRSKFDDPHGTEAVRWMVGFIDGKKAPPGFSKHTLGISVDFYQKRRIIRNGRPTDEWLTNSTRDGDKPGQLKWWRNTWLYKWLQLHAQTYGFKELKTEPWHYDLITK